MNVQPLAVENPVPDEPASNSSAYAPGWVDRLTAWIDMLPVPAAVIYLAAALALNGLNLLLRYRDGTFPTGAYLSFHLAATTSPVAYIALIHYLDRVALAAFRKVGPALTLTGIDARGLAWQLTTMSRRTTWIATGVGALLGLAAGVATLNGLIFRNVFHLNSLPVIIFGTALSIVVNSASILFVVHVLRQLGMINYINAHCVQVDLYHREPLYAFSVLTACTSIGWIAIAYAWVATYPSGAADLVNMAYAATFAVLSLVTFIWPLWGIHRRLDEAKIAAITEVVHCIRRSTHELHALVHAGRFDQVGPIGTTLTNLRAELDALEKIPTWPWRPETARAVYTAIFLPMLLWVLTRVLERIVVA